MKIKRLLTAIAAVTLISCIAWTIYAQSKPVGSKTVWEYQIQQIRIDMLQNTTTELNTMGIQGWELVGMFTPCDGCLPLAYYKRAR